jgi:putative ABC transport system permease protein
LAAVALLVACLGITNTMIMSVLERRREIGIMKAVGARDSHVQLIFLLEGALIGGIGGTLGMIGCWVASLFGDSTARQLLAQQNELPLKGTLFVFPLWLTLGVPLFVCLVTTLAALYPARRAARVNPIIALRHE